MSQENLRVYRSISVYSLYLCIAYVCIYRYVLVSTSYMSLPSISSHVSYEWVMSHMNESCLIWMGHVSYIHSTKKEYMVNQVMRMGWRRLVGSLKL